MDNEIITNEADGLVGTYDGEVESSKKPGLDAKSAAVGAGAVGLIALAAFGVKKLVKRIKAKNAEKRAASEQAEGQEVAELGEKKKSLFEKAKEKFIHDEETPES